MSRVDEMRELTGRLAVNHVERRQALGDLRREVNRQQADAAMAHAAMAAEQRATLAADRAALRQAVEALLADLAAVHVAMAAEQRATLAADRTARLAMAAEQRATLAADRTALRQAVEALLADLAAVHVAMAAEQRATLAADRTARHQAVDALLADLAAVHAAMAAEQRAFLEDDHETRSAAVASERTNLRHSLTEMAQVWHEFAAAPWGAPPPPTEAPVAPQAAETEDAAQKVLHYLNEHPEGAKLVDLEPQMDLARPQLGKLLRYLVDDGKLVKNPETLVYKLA